MPSGKQSKRRRRAGEAPAPPTRAARRASPRVLIAAAALVALVVIGIVLGVVLTRGSSDESASSTTAQKLPDAADVQQMFAGIPQHDTVLGDVSAPATMVEYVDLQCPYCQQFETLAMPSIISGYVRKGKLKVEVRPIAFIGVDSQRGRAALLAAGMQNKLFNFMQLIYNNQGAENTSWLDDDLITSAAASIPGVDVDQLLTERNSKSVSDRSSAIDQQGIKDVVKVTPTILIGPTGKKLKAIKLTSASDSATVGAAIDAALKS
jgi:protein-disulfide isomerase